MLTRVPDYYEAFHCLAGACPHTCCEKWEVVVDEETARRYQETPGSLGERLREALQTDEEGDFCFPLRGGRCPFLNRENLCEIHRILGAEATSLTCRTHPRFIEEYGPFREVSLCASCPAACDLLLGSTAPLSFLERETAEPGGTGRPVALRPPAPAGADASGAGGSASSPAGAAGGIFAPGCGGANPAG